MLTDTFWILILAIQCTVVGVPVVQTAEDRRIEEIPCTKTAGMMPHPRTSMCQGEPIRIHQPNM